MNAVAAQYVWLAPAGVLNVAKIHFLLVKHRLKQRLSGPGHL